MLITLLTVDGLTSAPNAGALVTENTTVWVGVIAALGGALVTGLLNLVGATIGERGRERAARFEEHQADKAVMRQAFAAYLDAAIRLHNALSVEAKGH